MLRSTLLRAGIFLALTGCVQVDVVRERVRIDHAPELIPIQLKSGDQVRPFKFERAAIANKHDDVVGESQASVACIKVGELKLGQPAVTLEMLQDTFRKESEALGYQQGPTSLFIADEPDFHIGASINRIRSNGCLPIPIDGAVFFSSKIAVQWEVLSRIDRRVIFQTETEGYAEAEGMRQTDMVFEDSLLNAFAAATRNLFADERLYPLITVNASEESKRGAERNSGIKPIEIRVASERREPFNGSVARTAIVTIRTKTGHGSGVLISSTGFILTNYHVIDDAREVQIILHTGRTVIGEVVRSDSARDIALIKIADEGFSPAPLTEKEPQVGSEVYALGAPFEEDLSGTVTQGVVSGYRVINDFRFVQSDVTVNQGNSGGALMDANGNLIAITAIGIGRNQGMVGLNFFIPVSNALEALNIKVAPVRQN